MTLPDAALQGRLYRSLKLWTFYCDLEESLGTLESARAVYDQILDLRIATPQIVLNYALFLEVRPGAESDTKCRRRACWLQSSGVADCLLTSR